MYEKQIIDEMDDGEYEEYLRSGCEASIYGFDEDGDIGCTYD